MIPMLRRSTPADRLRSPFCPDQTHSPAIPQRSLLCFKTRIQAAENPHERDRASYLPENWQPLHKTGQLELKPDDYEVVDGLSMETVVGHSKTMQTWRLDHGGKTLYGFADLIPTRHHLALPWIMGYDLFPTETLEFKRKIYRRP